MGRATNAISRTPNNSLCFFYRQVGLPSTPLEDLLIFEEPLTYNPPTNSFLELACASSTHISTTRLHALLGHQSFERIKNLLQTLYPNRKLQPFNLIDCEFCRYAKASVRPYPSATTSTVTRRLQRLRMDMSGRIPPIHGVQEYTSFTDSQAFLLIKDEYSHYLWFFPLPAATAEMITITVQDLLAHLHALFPGDPVAQIVTDKGREFENTLFTNYCRARGIELIHTPPGESQSNGLIEREMRTIKETGNTLLMAAGLHKGFWPYAYQHATRINNFMARRRRHDFMPADESLPHHYYPILTLYHVSDGSYRKDQERYVRHYLENLSIFGQGGRFLDAVNPRNPPTSVVNKAEPAIYLGSASDHFTSHVNLLLPNRGIVRTASVSTFHPADSQPYDYSQLYTEIIHLSGFPIRAATLKSLIPLWTTRFLQYQRLTSTAQIEGGQVLSPPAPPSEPMPDHAPPAPSATPATSPPPPELSIVTESAPVDVPSSEETVVISTPAEVDRASTPVPALDLPATASDSTIVTEVVSPPEPESTTVMEVDTLPEVPTKTSRKKESSKKRRPSSPPPELRHRRSKRPTVEMFQSWVSQMSGQRQRKRKADASADSTAVDEPTKRRKTFVESF